MAMASRVAVVRAFHHLSLAELPIRLKNVVCSTATSSSSSSAHKSVFPATKSFSDSNSLLFSSQTSGFLPSCSSNSCADEVAEKYDELEDELSEEEFYRRQLDLYERGFYVLNCSKSQQSFKGGQNACTAIGMSMSRKFLSKADTFSTYEFHNKSIFQKIIQKGVKWQRLWALEKAVDVNTKPSAYSLCELEQVARKVRVDSAVCYGGSKLDSPAWGCSISNALQLLFKSDNAAKIGAYLLTVAGYTTFVGKFESSILWFDSHLRDKNGLQDGSGSAVWMRFYGWENLRDHIRKLYSKHDNSSWELVGINKL